jgi:hypothetical protein
MQSSHDAATGRQGQAEKQGARAADAVMPENIHKKLEQLNINPECLRKKRLLGGAGNQNFEMFQLPVSRV